MLTINLEDKKYNKSLDKKFKTSIVTAFEKYGLLKLKLYITDVHKYQLK